MFSIIFKILKQNFMLYTTIKLGNDFLFWKNTYKYLKLHKKCNYQFKKKILRTSLDKHLMIPFKKI